MITSQAAPWSSLRHQRDGFALIGGADSPSPERVVLGRLVALRRRRLTLLLKMHAPAIIVRNERRLVRAAVNALRGDRDTPSAGMHRSVDPHTGRRLQNYTTSMNRRLS